RPLLLALSPPHLAPVLFSARPGSPRDLPSFPTRRSSDLALPLYERAGCAGAADRSFSERVIARLIAGFTAAGVPIDTRDDLASIDRKSTRLNSSHVKISYAVFCLKKKTKEHERDR